MDLTGKEICSIIKACEASGVINFTLGELAIAFTHKPSESLPEPQDEAVPVITFDTSEPIEESTEPQESHRTLNPTQLTEEEFQTYIDILSVEDPLAAEELMIEYQGINNVQEEI